MENGKFNVRSGNENERSKGKIPDMYRIAGNNNTRQIVNFLRETEYCK